MVPMPTLPLDRLPDALGTDVHALLRRHGVPVRAVAPVSGADSPFPAPRAFRVDLANGQVLKAVRATSAARAALVFAISRHLDRADFAPVLARHGAALLMPWIEGRPLYDVGWDTPEVRQAGRLLAALHALVVPDAAVRPGGAGLDLYTAKLRHDLGSLARRDVISVDERETLLALARTVEPSPGASGVIHRDLCADNLVRLPSGALCVVDVESVAIGACAYDLARTWYRWPMSAPQRAALFAAYASHGGLLPDWREFPFWAACAVVASCAQRRLLGADGAMGPIGRLRALLHDLRAGIDGEQLALHG